MVALWWRENVHDTKTFGGGGEAHEVEMCHGEDERLLIIKHIVVKIKPIVVKLAMVEMAHCCKRCHGGGQAHCKRCHVEDELPDVTTCDGGDEAPDLKTCLGGHEACDLEACSDRYEIRNLKRIMMEMKPAT